MLAEIKGRSQMTLPAEIVKKLGLAEGDKFEVIQKDGGIFLRPVVLYPKEKIAKIAKLVKDAQEETKKQTAFSSVEDLFSDMGIDLEETARK